MVCDVTVVCGMVSYDGDLAVAVTADTTITSGAVAIATAASTVTIVAIVVLFVVAVDTVVLLLSKIVTCTVAYTPLLKLLMR